MLTINLAPYKTLIDINIMITILYTSLLGPIFEEILFRYVALNKAKKYYKESSAIILITLIFALLHSGIINILYAFLIGLVLAMLYKKYNNILYPILLHVSANLTSVFIKGYNLYLLIIGFTLLLISSLIIKKTT